MTHRLSLTLSAPELRDLHALQALAGCRTEEETVRLALRILGRLGPAISADADAYLRYEDGSEEVVDLR